MPPAATSQAGRPVASQTQRPPEWARPATLLARLDQLVADDVEAVWAERTAQQIRRLTDTVVPLNQEVTSILADLRVAADEVAESAAMWRTPREKWNTRKTKRNGWPSKSMNACTPATSCAQEMNRRFHLLSGPKPLYE